MKSVLSIKKTVLSVFMILMLAMAMVGCGSSSSKSDKDVAKEKAAEVLALAQGVDVALENEEVGGFEALMENVERASAKYDEFLNFMDEKNIEGDDALEANEKIEVALALMEKYNAAVASIGTVREAIEALSEEITAADAAAVAAAREAYDALENAGYQAKVDIAKLEEAEEAIAGLNNEAIEVVEELIEGLIDADDVTFENVAEAATAYLAAKEAYDALSETAKAKVDTAKLDALEAKLTEISKEVKEVAPIDDITIAAGEELVLPETVEVTLYTDETVELEVTWNLDEFDNKVEEEYVITGTLVTGDDYSNSLELEATVKVEVTADVGKPVITLNGNAKVVVKLGDTYDDEGATAQDNEDGDLTNKIEVSTNVDTAVEETYTVTYTVEDAAGNEAKLERTVIVDGTAPVITLNGDNPRTISEGTEYKELGAYAEDEVSGEVDVVITGKVDVDKPGKYEVTYTAVDEAGNVATVTRTVTVTEAADPLAAVVDVSAIDTTGVTVEFDALTEALTDVTVEVKDGAGVVREVVAQDLAAGATVATFDFVTAVETDDLKDVWTVEGKDYSFTEMKLVAKIVVSASATPVNQVELFNLLTEAGIQNLDANSISDYATEIKTPTAPLVAPVWATDVQAIVDKVNEDGTETAAEEAVVKAVVDAENQIQLLAALEANFDRVNADWIAKYATAGTIGTKTGLLALVKADNYPGETNAVTVANIQNHVDTANVVVTPSTGALTGGEISTLNTNADTSVKQAKVTSLLETYVVADDAKTPLVTPKAKAVKASKEKEAAFKVAEATTENSLYNALVAYANATPDATLKASELNANLKAEYKAALVTLTPATLVATIKEAGHADVTNGIKAKLVTAVDTAALSTALSTINGLTAASTPAQVKAALQKLADVTAHKAAAAKFDMSTVIEAELVNYVTLATNGFAAATINSITLVNTAIEEVNEAIEVTALEKVIKESTDVAVTQQALVDLANLGKLPLFLNTPAADRTYVAQELVAIVDRNTVDTAAKVNTLIGSTINAKITAVVGAANAVTRGDTSDYAKTKLVLAEFKAYNDLGALAKIDAEIAFHNSLTFVIANVDGKTEAAGDLVKPFASYTELKAAVDAALGL